MFRLGAAKRTFSTTIRVLPVALILVSVGVAFLVFRPEAGKPVAKTTGGSESMLRPDPPSPDQWKKEFKARATLTREEVADRKKVAFDVQLPPPGSEALVGNLEGIVPGEREPGTGRVSDISMLFSKGFVISQFLPTDPLEIQGYSNYVEKEMGRDETQEDIRKGIVKKVSLNGVDALASSSFVQEQTSGEAWRTRAHVTWVRNGVFFDVWAFSPDTPLDTVLEVARLLVPTAAGDSGDVADSTSVAN